MPEPEVKQKPLGFWESIKSFKIPVVHIPRLYAFLKWCFLIIIAVSCALVGFFQSMLVSWIYEVRSLFIYRIVEYNEDWRLKGFEYIAFNLLLAFGCSFSMFLISPAASGSGIPDVKAYLNGVDSPIFKNFFTIKTFCAKVLASALAVSSGMAMGKEGPMLHAGSILAVIMGSHKWMQQQMELAAHWGVYTYNKELRDLVAIGAACGVTTAFKAPVGGVMFAMELATRWRKDLTWRCFLAAAITIVVVRLCVTTCVHHNYCNQLKFGSLIWFQQHYPTPYQQVWAMVILACIGGYLGCLFTSFNTWVCLVRKKWAKLMWARILEVCCISVFTSIVLYLLPTVGWCLDCTDPEEVGKLTGNCIKDTEEFNTFQGFHCPSDNQYNDMAVAVFNPQGFKIYALFTSHSGTFSMSTLAVYAAVYWFLAAVTYGAFIPSGLFTPSLIFGGCFGRLFAEILVRMGVADDTHVGMYALLGSAAFLGGLMRMSAAMALILMEMTQSPTQLPFLMLVLVVAKQVGDQFNYGVFEHQMMLKGLAFVGIDEEAAVKAKLSAKDVMTNNTRARTLYNEESVDVLERVLASYPEVPAFPVTTVPYDGPEGQGEFLGMISRKNVQALIDDYGRDGTGPIDLTPLVEVAPVIIPTNMPLPFIYRIVNAEGFNHVPVIRYHGPLEGIISRTELVDVQNRKLDEFHLQDQINKMNADIEQGKLLKSMNLGDNPHAARFKEGAQRFRKGALNFVRNPLQATQDFLDEEGEQIEDQQEFYLKDLRPTGRGSIGMHPSPSQFSWHHQQSNANLDSSQANLAGDGSSHHGGAEATVVSQPSLAEWGHSSLGGSNGAANGAASFHAAGSGSLPVHPEIIAEAGAGGEEEGAPLLGGARGSGGSGAAPGGAAAASSAGPAAGGAGSNRDVGNGSAGGFGGLEGGAGDSERAPLTGGRPRSDMP